MEMCYQGALAMPKSYAVMDEDEMMYVEGGGIKRDTLAWWINAFAYLIPVVSQINSSLKVVKCLRAAVAAARKTKKAVAKGVADIVERRWGKRILSTDRAEKILDIFWGVSQISIGFIIAEGIDRIDGCNNNVCFG